ncbi:TPA: DotI/IcmL/TraM family protein [Escherichia coli]|nr:DotI/IcmL/TraM family protein [Escherichia coli]HEA6030933.1 DotI/IcmL/TraM family protein [Escherichia coli]
MQKTKKPASAGKTKQSSREKTPYADAVALMKKAADVLTIGRGMIHVTLVLAYALAVVVTLAGWLAWKVAHPPVHYFSTENGIITRIVPTDEPGWSQNDAIDFGARALRESFSLDFVHFREQTAAVRPYYSAEGYTGYIRGLESSNILSSVRDDRMNLTNSIGAGVVSKTGRLSDGTWVWVIQYRVSLQLVGQKTKRPEQKQLFEVTIQRTDPRVKYAGMEIRQIISRDAPRD